MSSADEIPDTQDLLDQVIPLQPIKLLLLGSEDDPYQLDQLGPLTPCNDSDDTGFWLNLEEFVKPIKASQWEVNSKIDTAVARHIAAHPDTNTDFHHSEQPPRDPPDDSDPDSHVSAQPDDSDDEPARDTAVPPPSTAQLEQAHDDYARALVHNEFEIAFGPLYACQRRASGQEDLREPVGPAKLQSLPSKGAKKMSREEELREYRHQLVGEQHRIENYGRLF